MLPLPVNRFPNNARFWVSKIPPIARLLFAAHPFLILLPLTLDVPKSSSPLTLPTDPAVKPQESIWVSFAKDRFSFSCVFALRTPAIARDLTCPFSALDWL